MQVPGQNPKRGIRTQRLSFMLGNTRGGDKAKQKKQQTAVKYLKPQVEGVLYSCVRKWAAMVKKEGKAVWPLPQDGMVWSILGQ